MLTIGLKQLPAPISAIPQRPGTNRSPLSAKAPALKTKIIKNNETRSCSGKKWRRST
jgi:hypothetical protein